MASCNLLIELDQPDKPRQGGETVSGTVVVTTTAEVQCNALEVTSTWSTHGRGNIDAGDIDQQVVFQGKWEPNREYRYSFTLKTGSWPPTYYGTLLNVRHAIRARARIPWATDPTTNAEYRVVAQSPPEDLKPPQSITKPSHSIIGWVIGGILILLVVAMLSVVLLIFIVPIAVIAAGVWFVRVFLPRQVTGSIECTVEPTRVTAGDTIRGKLRFTPKRRMTIHSIQWTVTCGEKCVSGSGSDRKTHVHEILNRSEQLSGSGELKVGEPQSCEFSFQVPTDSPPSLKFPHNELNWVGELRIDIARWPDWVQKFPLIVAPTADSAATQQVTAHGSPAPATSAEEEWFYEVLRQVEQFQEDPSNLRMVLDAVRDQVFAIRVDIVEPLDEPPPSVRDETGTWRIASPRQTNVELAIIWPSPQDAPAVETNNWRGKAVILGFDSSLECLLLRVVPT